MYVHKGMPTPVYANVYGQIQIRMFADLKLIACDEMPVLYKLGLHWVYF